MSYRGGQVGDQPGAGKAQDNGLVANTVEMLPASPGTALRSPETFVYGLKESDSISFLMAAAGSRSLSVRHFQPPRYRSCAASGLGFLGILVWPTRVVDIMDRIEEQEFFHVRILVQ